jgi:hypothetical protein
MSGDRLRLAAAKIREAAALPMELTNQAEEPWFRVKPADGRDVTTKWDLFADAYPEDAALIVLMASPPVAVAVADWLDYEANTAHLNPFYTEPHVSPAAMVLADAVLGDK